jgi:hypothetical protein
MKFELAINLKTTAALSHFHGCQESRTLPPDHAELYSQEMPENAEANGAYQALLAMIRYRT